jgi:BirA family biotin operon repressor/biotin-[acetyl-CoA-carboxylase] ligase
VTRSVGNEPTGGGSGETILALLRDSDGESLSGEDISRTLKVSRSAVWKQIKSLRGLGYEISAEPSKGYRLVSAPDRLILPEIAAGLKVNTLGKNIVCLTETVSTNAVAFRMAEDGAAEGCVVIADCQTGGKGRMGRTWVSPPGVNFYCSIIVRPPIKPMAAPQLTFLSVVAVARSIELLTGLAPRIKWPNDLLLNGKKVAGLLNEMSAETDKVNFVVLGIGVNLNMRADQFPPELRHPATSILLETGKSISRVAFTRTLLQELDAIYALFLAEGYAPVRKEWLERSRLTGEQVTVKDNGIVQSGIVAGIDEYGALLLETADGKVIQILSGDVSIGGVSAAGN